jgi:hypothetical protein
MVDGLHPGGVRGVFRHGGEHAVGDVGEAARHRDARGRAFQLLVARGREEAVRDDVVLRRGVLLQDREEAVMVRDEQPVGGDEAARAAADVDGRGEQAGAALRIPQPRRRELQSLFLQPGRVELQHLLRRPLPLGRYERESEKKREKGKNESSRHFRYLARKS